MPLAMGVVVVDLFLTKSRTTPLCELRGGPVVVLFFKVRTPPRLCVRVAPGGLTGAPRLSAGPCRVVFQILLLLALFFILEPGISFGCCLFRWVAVPWLASLLWGHHWCALPPGPPVPLVGGGSGDQGALSLVLVRLRGAQVVRRSVLEVLGRG